MCHSAGKTQVVRVECGVEELLRWSANVCDSNTRTDPASTEKLVSFQGCTRVLHLESLGMAK